MCAGAQDGPRTGGHDDDRRARLIATVQRPAGVADLLEVEIERVSSAVLGLGGDVPLWLAGEMPARPRLAIVGARAAVAGLRAAVPPIVAAARRLGWSVCSGGALGIDGDAHRAALEAEVPQLVVLPSSPEHLYPPDHAPLFRTILQRGGGVLFCRPPGASYCRSIFASRNRWVVAAADALVVVQAEPRSGSCRTGTMALRAGKRVAAVVGSRGTAFLVAHGAKALAWSSSRETQASPGLTEMVTGWLQGRPELPSAPLWPPHLEDLLRTLERAGPRGVAAASLDPRHWVALTEAEARGWAVEIHPGRYVLGVHPG